MNDITPQVPLGRQLIQGYGGGGFRIAGQAYSGSVIVCADRTFAWPVTSFEDISVASLSDVISMSTEIEVLLIGCGARMGMPRADIRDALKAHAIVPEWMQGRRAAPSTCCLPRIVPSPPHLSLSNNPFRSSGQKRRGPKGPLRSFAMLRAQNRFWADTIA